jgi:hypothetical protein
MVVVFGLIKNPNIKIYMKIRTLFIVDTPTIKTMTHINHSKLLRNYKPLIDEERLASCRSIKLLLTFGSVFISI